MSKVAAIILAAGLSRRFGTEPDNSKVLAMLDGIPLIRHVAEAASASQARPIYVVAGRAGPKLKAALSGLDIRFIHNAEPEAGLSRSLALGLDHLAADVSGALVLLADMPYVSAPLIGRLMAAFETAPAETFAVVPVHAGRRGNPVLLGKAIFASVKAIKGDRGARGIIDAMDHGIVEVRTDDRSIAIDVDTRDMLDQLSAKRSGV